MMSDPVIGFLRETEPIGYLLGWGGEEGEREREAGREREICFKELQGRHPGWRSWEESMLQFMSKGNLKAEVPLLWDISFCL